MEKMAEPKVPTRKESVVIAKTWVVEKGSEHHDALGIASNFDEEREQFVPPMPYE